MYRSSGERSDCEGSELTVKFWRDPELQEFLFHSLKQKDLVVGLRHDNLLGRNKYHSRLIPMVLTSVLL